jgi:Fe-S-cluster containining protein
VGVHIPLVEVTGTGCLLLLQPYDQVGGRCPALVDGRCSVYDVRPLICRLYASAEGLRCPHGCQPVSGMLSDADAGRLRNKVQRISDQAKR